MVFITSHYNSRSSWRPGTSAVGFLKLQLGKGLSELSLFPTFMYFRLAVLLSSNARVTMRFVLSVSGTLTREASILCHNVSLLVQITSMTSSNILFAQLRIQYTP